VSAVGCPCLDVDLPPCRHLHNEAVETDTCNNGVEQDRREREAEPTP